MAKYPNKVPPERRYRTEVTITMPGRDKTPGSEKDQRILALYDCIECFDWSYVLLQELQSKDIGEGLLKQVTVLSRRPG